MKTIAAVLFLSLLSFSLFAGDEGASGTELEPVRGIFSVDAGMVHDGRDGAGYAGFIKSLTFLDNGPFYYGFASLFGSFTTAGEDFFESGLLVGYKRDLGKSGLDLDIFLDLLLIGGRINQETLTYRGEAPALHLGLSLGFPTFSNIDGALSVAPVIRPYNLHSGSWDFSGSYLVLSLSLRFKSFMLIEKHNWEETL